MTRLLPAELEPIQKVRLKVFVQEEPVSVTKTELFEALALFPMYVLTLVIVPPLEMTRLLPPPAQPKVMPPLKLSWEPVPVTISKLFVAVLVVSPTVPLIPDTLAPFEITRLLPLPAYPNLTAVAFINWEFDPVTRTELFEEFVAKPM